MPEGSHLHQQLAEELCADRWAEHRLLVSYMESSDLRIFVAGAKLTLFWFSHVQSLLISTGLFLAVRGRPGHLGLRIPSFELRLCRCAGLVLSSPGCRTLGPHVTSLSYGMRCLESLHGGRDSQCCPLTARLCKSSDIREF